MFISFYFICIGDIEFIKNHIVCDGGSVFAVVKIKDCKVCAINLYTTRWCSFPFLHAYIYLPTIPLFTPFFCYARSLHEAMDVFTLD